MRRARVNPNSFARRKFNTNGPFLVQPGRTRQNGLPIFQHAGRQKFDGAAFCSPFIQLPEEEKEGAPPEQLLLLRKRRSPLLPWFLSADNRHQRKHDIRCHLIHVFATELNLTIDPRELDNSFN